MKWLRWVAMVGTLTLVATACQGGEEPRQAEETGPREQVTLDYWVYQEGGVGSYLQALVTRFEAANPDINIKFTQYPEGTYGVKVTTAIAAGKPPDLVLAFSTSGTGLSYMRQGLLLPLDDMMAENGIDLSTFNQSIVSGQGEFTCAYGGKIYCLGSTQSGLGLFYNKDMFDAAGIPHPPPWPPMTVEQFADYACRLTDENAGIWGTSFGSTILPWEMSVSPDGKTVDGYINSPETVHQFDVLSGIIRDGCAPTANVMDPWEQSTDFFVSGGLAMAIIDYESALQIENAGIDYGVTGLPTPPGVEPFFDTWANNVGVLSGSEHPEEALKFIAFLATEGQKIAFETDGSIPLDNAVAEEVDWAQGIPGRSDALEVLSHARPSVFIPNKWDAWGPFYDAWDYMVSGEKTAQQALNDAAPAIQENLDKAWEVWESQA